MRVILFGATGMVGQGVLRECLLDNRVDAVLAIGRSPTGVRHAKLSEIVRPDLFHYSDIEDQLRGFDACFFCIGVSSVGMPEDEYERLTYQLTLAAAETLSRLNPNMTFIYVSGAGTDSSGKGRTAWARVKGRTENAIFLLPFRGAYAFRPAFIMAAHGERAKSAVYRALYRAFGPLLPAVRRLVPDYVLTTEQVGRAMIHVARHGAAKQVLESSDIRAINYPS